MSQTAGTNMNLSGEKPKWKLPFGNVPDLVAKYYFRSDTPTGRSVEMPPPNAVSMFRQLIQSGAIVADNQAAQNMAMSEGGIQNGQTSMFGEDVPFIEGLPGGMDAATWNALTARTEQKWQERKQTAELTGEWNGKSTLERERIEAEIKRDIFKNETDRYTAEQNVRQEDVNLSRLEREREDARRAGDLDREQALNIEIDRQKAKREEMSGWIGGEGGQATLGREDQAFQQSVKAAELAANPRTGIQSWMMGQRGGLNGQPAVNFVPPTTTAPGQAQINPVNAWQMPGGTTTTVGKTPTSGPGAGAAGFVPPMGQDKAAAAAATPPAPAFGMGSGAEGTVHAMGTQGTPDTNMGMPGAPEAPELEKKKVPSLSGTGGGLYGTGGGIEDQLAMQQIQQQADTLMQSPQYRQLVLEREQIGDTDPARAAMIEAQLNGQLAPFKEQQEQIFRAQPDGGLNGLAPWSGAGNLTKPMPGMPTQLPSGMDTAWMGMPPQNMRYIPEGGFGGMADGLVREPWQQPGGFQMPNAKEQAMRQMMAQRQQAQMANSQMAAALGRDPNAASLDPAYQQRAQLQQDRISAFGQPTGMADGLVREGPWSQPMVQPTQAGAVPTQQPAQVPQQPAQPVAAPAQQPAAAPQGSFGAAMQQTAQKTGPTATQTGQNTMPTTAFTESLMQGKAVPNQGNGTQQGQWWNPSQFQQTANPGKWRVQDFMKGTRDEQQGALGAASFAGFSDETSQDLLKKQLPQFSAPRSGRLA